MVPEILRVTIDGTPPSVNEMKRGDWAVGWARVSAFREATMLLTLNVTRRWKGFEKTVFGQSQLYYEGPWRMVIRHFPLTYVGDHHNREKAIIDGFCDALKLNDKFITVCSYYPIKVENNDHVDIEFGLEDWWRGGWLEA
jgi:hypothetical protein